MKVLLTQREPGRLPRNDALRRIALRHGNQLTRRRRSRL